MKHVKRYWSMGTAGFGQGNATPVAEFNVYHDAEAYKVFADSGVPITVLGFDMMNDDVRFTKEELEGNYSVAQRNPQFQHKVENWKGTEKNQRNVNIQEGKKVVC